MLFDLRVGSERRDCCPRRLSRSRATLRTCQPSGLGPSRSVCAVLSLQTWSPKNPTSIPPTRTRERPDRRRYPKPSASAGMPARSSTSPHPTASTAGPRPSQRRPRRGRKRPGLGSRQAYRRQSCMRLSQPASMTWILVAALCPKNRSRSSAVVADTGQMHPRGQSLGNQNIGATAGNPPPTPARASGWRPRHAEGTDRAKGTLAGMPQRERGLPRSNGGARRTRGTDGQRG